MRILVCSKRDLSAVVILNDLLERLTAFPEVSLSLMLAERTRPVETVVPELIRMKALERDLPFGVLFPLIESRSADATAAMRALGSIADPDELADAVAAVRPTAIENRLYTLDRLMAHHRLSYRLVHGLKDPDVLAAVEAFAPDLIVSVRFSFRLSASIIAAPRIGAINIHPGRLPDYAGLYPHFFSMLAGEPYLGCTVHVVDQGLDSGPILATGEVPFIVGCSAFAANLDAHLLGNRLTVEIVRGLIDGGQLTGKAQDMSEIRQHTYPTTEEFRAFRMKGLSLIHPREYVDILARFGFFEANRTSGPHCPV